MTSEKQKSTPGPWMVDEQGDIVSGHLNVCIPYATSAEDKALIAAAPDLLAAILECRMAETRRLADLKPGSPASSYTAARLARIDAAIAKAEGRS